MGHLRAFAATLAVFLACAEHASVDAAMMDDDIITVPRVVQYQLLSIYSGRFVGVTTDGCIHAMGDIRGDNKLHNSLAIIISAIVCFAFTQYLTLCHRSQDKVPSPNVSQWKVGI